MDDYIRARPDVFFTGADGSLRSNRAFCQTAGLYACDMFIGSTLQIDLAGHSSTVTTSRVAGFGGAPNMGSDPRGRRHPSDPWLKAGRRSRPRRPAPLRRGRKLVVQIGETFGEGNAPLFVERLDALDLAEKLDLELAPVMVYADDTTHIVTEEGDRQPAALPRPRRARAGHPRRRRLHRDRPRARQGHGGEAARAQGDPAPGGPRRSTRSTPTAACSRPARSRTSCTGPAGSTRRRPASGTGEARTHGKPRLPSSRPRPGARSARLALVGVVASGNLEVLAERVLPGTDCEVRSPRPRRASATSGPPWWPTSSSGARPAGCAVDQRRRRPPRHGGAAPGPGRALAGGRPMSATPGGASEGGRDGVSWYEASARQRVRLLLDEAASPSSSAPSSARRARTFTCSTCPSSSTTASWWAAARWAARRCSSPRRRAASWAAPSARCTAPSSPACCAPRATVHALPVLILFDTGGVRLQEANAGELAIAEIMRALVEARAAGARWSGSSAAAPAASAAAG